LLESPFVVSDKNNKGGYLGIITHQSRGLLLAKTNWHRI